MLPELFFLSPLSATLLRIAAAICFAYIAWYLIKNQGPLTQVPMIIIGHMHAWMLTLSSFIIAVISVLLFVGAWTQIAAIIGAIVAIKHVVFYRRYASILPFSKSTYLLLLCICLSLIVTGAGAFSVSLNGFQIPLAFDLPL